MITIVFLAGGQSKRMGADKAIKPFLGIPLIQRLIHRFSVLDYPMMVISNTPQLFKEVSIPVVQDVEPGHGALGGLLSALSLPKTKYVGLIACDMPFANAQLVETEYQLLLNNSMDAVVPTTYAGYEPFHAVYQREICLEHVQRDVLNGERKLISWFDHANIFEYPVKLFDPQSVNPELFYNMNTPADWAYAERIAKTKGMQWGELAN
jgi:molybdopterin-guanine dinucleotide biosynthesis protein A